MKMDKPYTGKYTNIVNCAMQKLKKSRSKTKPLKPIDQQRQLYCGDQMKPNKDLLKMSKKDKLYIDENRQLSNFHNLSVKK